MLIKQDAEVLQHSQLFSQSKQNIQFNSQINQIKIQLDEIIHSKLDLQSGHTTLKPLASSKSCNSCTIISNQSKKIIFIIYLSKINFILKKQNRGGIVKGYLFFQMKIYHKILKKQKVGYHILQIKQKICMKIFQECIEIVIFQFKLKQEAKNRSLFLQKQQLQKMILKINSSFNKFKLKKDFKKQFRKNKMMHQFKASKQMKIQKFKIINRKIK
ncbi:hypothetical protein TTHERM_000382177 (macronuclear) [Tetrahymena thermophila SB210]|uniref:Uncharacterized protein n=1 Tax=Tetrahymena thermophila (strain SB210) TaxID=312017 RepID=W7XK08_TETTS|nr:hypothetical protein TTHERM_000382177 [Tetrahymena thermophila SB210]EWS74494.1 hypothetical protein TTHERM_000382177 [Tetrahymena thermophila SB210]|eukprot:XP_012652979.1 hypothetical protein TTHERM_000382177 [Tetrahymena thermophila SB210]